MYVLINENNKVFAIIKNSWKNRVITAIEEEYSLKSATINDDFRFPDYCENIEINFFGLDDDINHFEETILITKIVDY